MKDAHNYNQNYNRKVVLIHSGAFCRAYDENALVLVALTGYQITQQKNKHIRCGFKKDMVTKVKNMLKEHKVSYVELLTKAGSNDAEQIDAYTAPDDAAYVELKKRGHEIYIGQKEAIQKMINASMDQTFRTVTSPTSTHISTGHTYYENDNDGKNAALTFIENLCNGIHPISKNKIDMLDLNEADIIRGLFAVKEFLA